MIPPQPLEIAYKFCFGMLNIGDMQMPHYWSNLFLAMRSILDEDELKELHLQIKDVDLMCGYSYDEESDSFKPVMKLYEIETYLMNSWNLKRYFLVNGKKVTQFDIEKALFDIKYWCFQRLFQLQHEILFTKPPIRI
jgi:hypothetical protein